MRARRESERSEPALRGGGTRCVRSIYALLQLCADAVRRIFSERFLSCARPLSIVHTAVTAAQLRNSSYLGHLPHGSDARCTHARGTASGRTSQLASLVALVRCLLASLCPRCISLPPARARASPPRPHPECDSSAEHARPRDAARRSMVRSETRAAQGQRLYARADDWCLSLACIRCRVCFLLSSSVQSVSRSVEYAVRQSAISSAHSRTRRRRKSQSNAKQAHENSTAGDRACAEQHQRIEAHFVSLFALVLSRRSAHLQRAHPTRARTNLAHSRQIRSRLHSTRDWRLLCWRSICSGRPQISASTPRCVC